MDVVKLLTEKAQKYPQRPAVIFKEQAISFLQLKEMAFGLAEGLRQLGLKKGERAAIYLPNCPEYIYSYLATWCRGGTCVPLDFMLTEEELVSCLAHAEVKVLIARAKAGISLERLKQSVPTLEQIILTGEGAPGFLRLQDLLTKVNPRVSPIETQDKDRAIIFYTSGTTGKPKGVLVNYQQLDAPPQAIKYFVQDVREDDTVICALPFSHLGGLIAIQANLSFGVTVVLMERFLPLEFLKNIERYKVNWFWLVPSMYYAFLQLKEFESVDLSSLRWLDLFGAPSATGLIRRFHQHCPQTILFHGWGLTETNAPTTVIPRGSKKIESVGRPAPWIKIKIFDENDQEVAAGESGEIAVQGWIVTDGYYKDPELTAEALRNGWFHTGDLGRIDAEGDLFIMGRKKEMIKVAGEIVFEPEVEAALHKHPDILEAAVVGVPDNLRGEVPKAFVVLKGEKQISPEDLRYFLREHLAHYKIPHHFEFVKSLSKNRAGKIDKEPLRHGA